MTKYQHIHFIGIGGIGMSALARYFNNLDITVTGYDKTPSALTTALEKEGITIHFEDRGTKILQLLPSKNNTLIIYTPAVPQSLEEYQILLQEDFTILKRAAVLGLISKGAFHETVSFRTLAVAGTHGKTTTSCLLAHVIKAATGSVKAFLGGISTNYQTNMLMDAEAEWLVVEADEFDRSFLHLAPYGSIITSTDADHLDIFGDGASLAKTFQEYVELVPKDGIVVQQANVLLKPLAKTQISYNVNNPTADVNFNNLRYENGIFIGDLHYQNEVFKGVSLGLPGLHNAQNAAAVFALCYSIGIDPNAIIAAFKTFQGVKRRFETLIQKDNFVMIDDYAHHPTAIEQLISSVRLMYPEKSVSIVFQPHLYSRTRDFIEGFASTLASADQIYLLPVYPAREPWMEEGTSEVLFSKIHHDNKYLLQKEDFMEKMKNWLPNGVLLTVGAGDIDRLVPTLFNIFSKKLP